MSSPAFLVSSESFANQEGSGIQELTDQGVQTEEEELSNEGDNRCWSKGERKGGSPKKGLKNERSPQQHEEQPESAIPCQDRAPPSRIPFLPNRGSRRRRGTNYTEQYPPDELGGEMGPNARVWRVYLDEADEYDAEMMDAFKDTTDVLLVFAGLFSAVVSTFVSQASQALQPDYAQVTASLMTEMVLLQRAIATGTPVIDIPISQLAFSNADMTTTSLDRWVNGLWFTSLSLSLVSALLAVLVKQWLQHYISALSGTPRDRVLVRHFRFMGLRTWKVSEIIETLPVLLHISLFMFMAGLVIFVWTLDLAIAYTVLSIAATCLLFYSLSNILASVYPSCSYKTPISQVLSIIWSSLRSAGTFRLSRLRPVWDPAYIFRTSFRFFDLELWISCRWLHFKPGKHAERDASENEIDSVLLSGLEWLHSASSDPSASAVVVQSMAGLPFHIDEKHTSVMDDPARNQLYSIYDPQNVGADFGVMLLAYCATRGSTIWLSDRYYDAYIALRPLSPPIIQRLSAFLCSYSAPRERIPPNIISDQISLPPWIWKSLFEYGKWDYSSDPVRLLVMLLNVLEEAELMRKPAGIFHKANWTLPSTIGLVELCKLDCRMMIIILRFACQYLPEPAAQAIQKELGALYEDTNYFRALMPAIVKFVQGILDQIQARLEVIGSIQEYLTTVESTLLSTNTVYWLEPTFTDALHRCIVLKNKTRGSDPTPVPLYHREPVAESTTLLMLYILDVLQHPWPTSRVADIRSPHQFEYLCYRVFSKREQSMFETFIQNNGLATFRRCFPYQFTRRDPYRFMDDTFFQYLKFVTKLDDNDIQQHHLAVISQRDNLAWLMWLPLTARGNMQEELRKLLRTLPVEKQTWSDAAEVLIEELRKDSALLGIQHLDYAEVTKGLEALGLIGDGFRLYGYVSEAVGYPTSRFQRVIEPGNEDGTGPSYGPYAVYYSLKSSPSAPPQPPASESKSWSQHVTSALRRLKPTNILPDLESGAKT